MHCLPADAHDAGLVPLERTADAHGPVVQALATRCEKPGSPLLQQSVMISPGRHVLSSDFYSLTVCP